LMAERKARSAWVVVDAQRQSASLGHRRKVLEHLLVRQLNIRHGRKQQARSTRLLSITSEPLRLVGTQRTHADDDRNPTTNEVHGRLHGALPLCPGQISVAARAAEQPDAVGSGFQNSFEEAAEGS